MAVRSVNNSTPSERQHQRYAAEVGIKVYFGNVVTEGRTRNVSRGGLCADLAAALPLGKDVELDMTLVFDDQSQSEALRLPARIVWCTPFENGYQIGVSFRPMDKQRAEYLALFLKYLGDEKPAKTPKSKKSVDDQFG